MKRLRFAFVSNSEEIADAVQGLLRDKAKQGADLEAIIDGITQEAIASYLYAADLPDAHAITAQPLDEDSLIYSADGTLLADIHMPGLQHYYEQLDQMGKWLPGATVATSSTESTRTPRAPRARKVLSRTNPRGRRSR